MKTLHFTLLALGLVLLAPFSAVADGERDSFSEEEITLKTKSWKVPAEFIDPSDKDASERKKIDDELVIENLKASGVTFPKGATASYKNGKLTVQTTPSNLMAVEEALEHYWSRQPDMYKATWKLSREAVQWAGNNLKREMKERESEGFDSIRVSGAKVTAVGPEYAINNLGEYLVNSYNAEPGKKKLLGKKGQGKVKPKSKSKSE